MPIHALWLTLLLAAASLLLPAQITGVSPARHGVLYNGMPAATPEGKPLRAEQWVPKEKLVLFPTLYDKLFEAGFTTAEVDWVAVFQAKTITWSFPEIPVITGAVEKEMIGEGLLSSEDATNFFKSSPVWRDDQWTRPRSIFSSGTVQTYCSTTC